MSPVVSNATPEAAVEDEGPFGPLPSLLTQQEGDMTTWVWLNGEFRMKPWTQMTSRAPESPPDQPGDEVSMLSRACWTLSQRGCSPVVTQPRGLTVCETSQMAT